MKDQAPFSFMRELNSSASSEYDWYVEGSSSMGPQVRIIGLRPAPSSILNVTKIESHVITLLPVKNERNWEKACPSRDLIYLLRVNVFKNQTKSRNSGKSVKIQNRSNLGWW